MREHGGRILAAARQYGIAPAEWFDLSTGINPLGWPVPAVPPETWRRLPEAEDGLADAAALYYGCSSVLPVAGSQPAIQTLPMLRAPCRVGVLAPSYVEHARAWSRRGHHVEALTRDELEAGVCRCDVIVICNPNNPTGARFHPDTLLAWHERLATRGGWLVVDEAFVDATPELSIASHAGRPGLVVLRSLGKFFGLAGARVGFILAWEDLLARLSDELGPWTVNGAGRWVAIQALRDEPWQRTTRQRLQEDSQRLASLLSGHGLRPSGSTALFQWVVSNHASHLHEFFARRAILVRYFSEPNSLRFGVPGTEAGWQRLAETLDRLQKSLGDPG